MKEKKILLSHENIDGFEMLKMPGGGLEPGEGLIEGLEREFKEELNIPIDILKHVYTTDHFIQSNFRQDEQVLAIYYEVGSASMPTVMEINQSTRLGKVNKINFVWRILEESLLSELSFETDRIALRNYLKSD